jgi:hypothetical protein
MTTMFFPLLSSRTYAGHEDVHLSSGVPPYFLRDSLPVRLGVGRILELERHETAANPCCEFPRFIQADVPNF